MTQPLATIVFSTYNRADLLRQAIQSAKQQSVPIDIIVMDDASTDSTPEMMATEFPEIQYHRSTHNRGPCYQRNEGIKHAQTDIVFPLDDDSILDSPFTIEQTLTEFSDDQIGAIAIPFINVLQDSVVWTQSPDPDDIYLTHAFVAAAHAVRRSAFLEVGGYRDFFFYMGEEGDLSIRLLQKGYCVRLGRANPIHHYQPPNRVSSRADICGRQNDILFVHCNVPNYLYGIYLLGTTLKGILFGLQVKRPQFMLKGFLQGYRKLFQLKGVRSPVDSDCFRIFRILKRNGTVKMSQIKTYLNGRNVAA